MASNKKACLREKRKVLIDTDPGTDDAIALLMALGPALSPPNGLHRQSGVDVLGITTVGGNASLARTTRNTLAVLEYAGRADVPVARGASRPLRGAFPYAYYFHGPGGLSVRLPAPQIVPCPESAVEYLRCKLLASPESACPERCEGVILVALGPLTNVAKLLRRYPEVRSRLSGLVVMGGAVGVSGNVTPYAEFNFYSDPLAASVVLSSGVAVTLVDLRVCRQASIERDGLAPLLKAGRSGRLAGRILANWFRRNPDKKSYDLCDPLAMAVAMEPDILTTRRGRVEVQHSSTERLGETTLEGSEGDVQVASEIDTRRFFEVFYGALAWG